MARVAKLTPELRQEYATGVEQLQAARWVEAEATYRHILVQRPEMPEAHLHLGLALKNQGKPVEAVAAFGAALALRPEYLEAWNNLGNIHRMMHQPGLAIEAYRRALALRQDIALSWSNLALALNDTAQFDEAMACLERAITLQPEDQRAYHDRLFMLRYHTRFDAPAIHRETRAWSERFAAPLRRGLPGHANDPSPQRRLRVGYVSAQFRGHCEALFTTPLFAHHDHARFEIVLYSDVQDSDRVTPRLRSYADLWRSIAGMPDDQVARLIRGDGIDILVDLALHSEGCRLLVFARQPAPIQVTWLAYPGTTGLDAIDYRLTDPRLDPLDSTAATSIPESPTTRSSSQSTINNPQSPIPQPIIQHPFYSERSFYLPDCFWCYDAEGMKEMMKKPLPDAGPLPALASGRITFGGLNNFSKVTDRTLELWGRLLAALPAARLVMFAPPGPGPHRERVLQKLGVGPQRVEFVPFQMRWEYLETYRRIDICLDTLPCGGGTTSFDALWMGVPLLTRVGQTVAGRAGYSLLYQLGLTDLVAWTDEQFVRQGVAWAGDLERLAGLRATLRRRMEQSPLMDAARFARNVEAAYRWMWMHWCEHGKH